MIEFYKMIVFPLQKKGDLAYDVFQEAVFDFEGIIAPLNLANDIKAAFKEELFKQFTPKEIKIKAVFEMSCYSVEGIEDIKKALKEGEKCSTKELKLDIVVLAAPKYIIQCQTIKKKQGIEKVNEALKAIEEYITKREGQFIVKELPSGDEKKELAIKKILTNNIDSQTELS